MEIFNHHMMTLAREARGVTQAELSARLNIVQGTLSKYETGFVEPPTQFIEDLSMVLGFLPDFFFESGRPYGLPPFHFRRRKKLPAKSLSKIVAEMNVRRIHISRLLLSFGSKTNRFIPEFDPDEYSGSSKERLTPEVAARVVREMWMLPSGPIPNMMQLLESNGGLVVSCDFGTDLIDAMSQRIDGMPVLFFVNMNSPADRLRHTLAHELGHMVMHTVQVKSDEEMETEADEFAGSFLLPANEIRPQLRRFDLRQLANLKIYWKVSMAALAVRADRLNLITPYQSKMFWIEMGKLGYRKQEPNEIPKEFPSVMRQMIQFHLNKLGYSVAELATLLFLRKSEFEAMYSRELFGLDGNMESPKPKLRLVT